MSATTILFVSNPRASHASLPLIDLDLHTVEHGVIPCSVAPNDFISIYGMGGATLTNAGLYALALVGMFGPVAPYVNA